MANGLWAGGETDSKYWRYSGFSSTITSSIAAVAASSAYGITVDGTDMYYSDNAGKAYKGTGFALTPVKSSFTLPASNNAYGMFYYAAGPHTYIGQDITKQYKLTGFSATVSASVDFASSPNSRNRGITFDGTNTTNSNIWSHMQKLSGFSVTVSASFTTDASTHGGVAYDDSANLIAGVNAATGKVRKYSGFSSTVSSSFNLAGAFPRSIAWGDIASSLVKTWNGVAKASVKTLDAVAIASVKTIIGVA